MEEGLFLLESFALVTGIDVLSHFSQILQLDFDLAQHLNFVALVLLLYAYFLEQLADHGLKLVHLFLSGASLLLQHLHGRDFLLACPRLVVHTVVVSNPHMSTLPPSVAGALVLHEELALNDQSLLGHLKHLDVALQLGQFLGLELYLLG